MEASTRLSNDSNNNGAGKNNAIRIGAVVVIAVVVAFVAWILIDRSDNDSAATTTPIATVPSTTGPAAQNPVGPVLVTQKQLSAQVAALGHPVYWAGPISGRRYEYTLTTTGRAFVRYVPQGVKAGDPRADFLIVATYPFPKSFRALKQVAKGREVKIPGGGIALVDEGYPQSVHFAFPGVDYQGEVYDPSPTKALQVATSGDLSPFLDRMADGGSSCPREIAPARGHFD